MDMVNLELRKEVFVSDYDMMKKLVFLQYYNNESLYKNEINKILFYLEFGEVIEDENFTYIKMTVEEILSLFGNSDVKFYDKNDISVRVRNNTLFNEV